MEVGRRCLVTLCCVLLLTVHCGCFIHYKDMFTNLKVTETEKDWKTCPVPEQIRNGQTIVWGDGLLLEYKCDKNFFAVGLTHGACDPTTGRWTILKPVCVASGCPDLQPPRHGVLHIDKSGGVAKIACHQGYYVMGSAKLLCENGRWVGNFPFCAVNARVRPTSSAGNKIPSALLRLADESCFQYQVDPPRLDHSVMRTSYVYSDYRKRYIMVAHYSCEGGYRLADPSSKTMYCQNSVWGAPIVPECTLENDPCKKGNGGCSQICVSQIGRYSCTCREGHTLGEDYRTCYDLNECVLNNGGCEQECHNTIGSFFCFCSSGYLVKGKGCIDKDECKEDHRCPGPCINVPGSYKCDCSIPGYRPSSAEYFCLDFDECSVNNGGCEDICINVRGSYECRCDKKGLRLSDDLHSCIDYNECERYGEKLCRHGRCINMDGSFRCQCDEGFEPGPDGTTCEDTDECLLNNGECEGRCENQFGGFSCYCDFEGYVLGDDGFSCDDIDECVMKVDKCEDTCVNVPGTYKCKCRQVGMVVSSDNVTCTTCDKTQYYSTSDEKCHPCPENSAISPYLTAKVALSYSDCTCLSGFDGNPRRNIPCTDRDECALGEIRCEHGCTNLPGSAQCECLAGYTSEADNVNCVDIDECSRDGAAGCNHICVNIPGSYRCECDGAGYIMLEDQHTCKDINECVNRNYCSHGCENVEGSAVCLCPDGYKLSMDLRSCVDLDECSLSQPPCDQICINSVGSYECQCREGYKLSWDKKACIDVNECMEGRSICFDSCINTVGSFKCLCNQKGYKTSDDGFSCEDIDECSKKRTRQLCEQECVNIPGSYKCDCYAGYRRSGATRCVACAKGFYRSENDIACERCPTHSTTRGSASTSLSECKCSAGYQGNPGYNVPCEDVDECENNELGCSHLCVNVAGSAYCTCPRGFTMGKDRKSCIDIDECAQHKHNCKQKCVNTIGSYHCGCDHRYFQVGSDEDSCIDLNECEQDNFGCADKCVNTIGSAHCECTLGYLLMEDGKGCKDLDECLKDNGGCDDKCVNSVGSYSCECSKEGFEQYHYNSKRCVDINECARFSPCDDFCKNTYGSFTCHCRIGYRLAPDGRSCDDIDECKENLCKQACVNLRGSYRCDCQPGYHAAGTDCKECPMGTYKAKTSNKASCTKCPAKSITVKNGSSSVSDCVCPDGYSGQPAAGVPCYDINECTVNNGGCQHRCHNTPGSYSCSCRSSHKLQPDMKSCSTGTCPTLKRIQGGKVWPPACTTPREWRKLKQGTVCSYRCGKGYELQGQKYRKCRENSTWTGLEIKCRPKYCKAVEQPRNGIVHPPSCLSKLVPFRQHCTFSCNKGYILVGKPEIKCKSNQKWSTQKMPRCKKDLKVPSAWKNLFGQPGTPPL